MFKIDFKSIYDWFDGKIWERLDCGKDICSDAKCCGKYLEKGKHTFIFFLPGELDFLIKSLGHRLSMNKINADSHYHCNGKRRCIYKMRPIDCRSYPLWPKVENRVFEGFQDHRGERCPIKILPYEFIAKSVIYWDRLFKEYPELLEWIALEFPNQNLTFRRENYAGKRPFPD
ncbi:MAG: hypothetical protein KKD86_15010 [Bacteroidetes bacterium]|nr:hypothetical protein [Bacteroidota bacterium]